MPSKGERTRQRILDRAGSIFNERGYHTTTLADLQAATGLEKGGLYNHFGSKDDLALAAFDHNVAAVTSRVRNALTETREAVPRLVALIEAYRDFAHKPPFPGGCPILNTAVQAHAAGPKLQARVRDVMDNLLDGTVARIVQRGLERGEIRNGIDPDAVASVMVSSIEGALLLTDMYDDPSHFDRVADHLVEYARTLGGNE
ncbi:MAG: TetR/AcrR family transcriptional regulator [Acidimicrobiales bacterium]